MCNEGNENIWEIKCNSLKLYEPKESRNVIYPEKEIKKPPTWNNKTNYDNRIIFSLLPYWLFSLSSLFAPIPVKGQAEKLLKIPIKARQCLRY